MADDIIPKLGPLGKLVGTWKGDKGDDVAPGDDRGTENNKYHEQTVFEPLDVVNNHEQTLYGLRYKTTAWRIGEPNPFHEDSGYWLWDAQEKQVMKAFIVPRGVSVLAGGTVEADATSFKITADVGSPTYGVCSNKFLDREFKTVRFELKMTITDKTFTYESDTQIIMKGQKDIFHHTDKNTLTKV